MKTFLAPAVVATLASTSACNPSYAEPEVWRAGPGPIVVLPGEAGRNEVRGCVLDDSINIIDDGVGFIIAVNAEVESLSDGTAELALTYEMVGDEYDEHGMNIERASVLGGKPATLTEDHVFLELPILLNASDRTDACSAWKNVDFSWSTVSEDSLEVTWEVGFRAEVEQAAALGIDFRSYPED